MKCQFTKNDYEKRVDGIRFQLLENWCLCKYCQLYCPSKNEFKHWIRELKTCINNIKFLDIKNGISKARILTKMLVYDYDYNKPSMILRIISDKFTEEKLNGDILKAEKVANLFANSIEGLIDVMSSDTLSTNAYVTSIFGLCN